MPVVPSLSLIISKDLSLGPRDVFSYWHVVFDEGTSPFQSTHSISSSSNASPKLPLNTCLYLGNTTSLPSSTLWSPTSLPPTSSVLGSVPSSF